MSAGLWGRMALTQAPIDHESRKTQADLLINSRLQRFINSLQSDWVLHLKNHMPWCQSSTEMLVIIWGIWFKPLPTGEETGTREEVMCLKSLAGEWQNCSWKLRPGEAADTSTPPPLGSSYKSHNSYRGQLIFSSAWTLGLHRIIKCFIWDPKCVWGATINSRTSTN